MTKLYETSPLAIELKVLVNDANKQPTFSWVTITLASIQDVSPAQTKCGGGATVTLKTGAMLLVSNAYRDISDAMIGDAKRFSEDPEAEAEILAGQPQPGAGPEVGDIADAMSGIESAMGLEDEDFSAYDENDEDYDTGSL